MNTDQLGSLVRTLLKFISALLIAHGMKDTATALNTPDIIGALTLGVSLLWSHYSHSSKAPASGVPPKTGGAALLVALCAASLFFTGCASSLNKKAFDAEMAAATTGNVAMKSYGLYWDSAYTNPTNFHRTAESLIAERRAVSSASIKLGAGIELVEGLRASYATNSALEPQLTAALLALQANTAQLLPYVLSSLNVTTNKTTP